MSFTIIKSLLLFIRNYTITTLQKSQLSSCFSLSSLHPKIHLPAIALKEERKEFKKKAKGAKKKRHYSLRLRLQKTVKKNNQSEVTHHNHNLYQLL